MQRPIPRRFGVGDALILLAATVSALPWMPPRDLLGVAGRVLGVLWLAASRSIALRMT